MSFAYASVAGLVDDASKKEDNIAAAAAAADDDDDDDDVRDKEEEYEGRGDDFKPRWDEAAAYVAVTLAS